MKGESVRLFTTLLELAGMALAAFGAGLWNLSAGLIVGGLFLIVAGAALGRQSS